MTSPVKSSFLAMAVWVLFGACGCGTSYASGPTPSNPATDVPNYQQNVQQTSAWLATQQLSDGAILYTSGEIEPYFSNLAAIGWLADTTKIPQVEAWMRWYINHFNWPDYNGLYGTVYDYNVSNGVETSTGSYDSTDSYAATFLSLAEALWNTGDAGAQAFIRNIGEYDFNVVGNVITDLQQSNGLVYAKPDYQVEYLMDNSEDYRGLMDFAALATQAWGDTNTTTWYTIHANNVLSGVNNVLYIPLLGLYRPYAGDLLPNLNTWYPDAIAQIFPIINGLISPTSAQAQTLYSKFNAAWPGWPQLSFGPNSFPTCDLGYASYLMGDSTRTNQYITTIETKYVNVTPQFPWPFYSAEAGWFMRTNAGMASAQ